MYKQGKMKTKITLTVICMTMIVFSVTARTGEENGREEVVEAATAVAQGLRSDLDRILEGDHALIDRAMNTIGEYEKIHRVSVVSDQTNKQIEEEISDLFIKAQHMSGNDRDNAVGQALFLETSYISVSELIKKPSDK